MIYECDKCKGEMLTEADPYLIVPKPDGTEIVCHKCFENKLVQQKALLDKYKNALDVAMKYVSAYDEIDSDALKTVKEINQVLGKEEGSNGEN